MLPLFRSEVVLCRRLCFRNMQAVVLQLFVAGVFVTSAQATPTGLVSIIFIVV